MPDLLRLEKICCSDATSAPVTTNLSLSLGSGEALQVTGRAESGRTILLEIIIKERRPESGEALYRGRPLFGKDAWKRTELRQEIGVIFRDNCLLPDRNVFENVAMPLEVKGFPPHRIAERVAHALGEVGLIGKSRLDIFALSATEQRLLSLARILVKMPPLVLADLSSSDVDQQVIVPHLERLATFGSGVLIFSESKTRLPEPVAPIAEVSLR